MRLLIDASASMNLFTVDPVPTLLKALIDQVLKRLPDASDKVRLRGQEELLRHMVDRNKELENVAELFSRVEAQRDQLLEDVIRLRLRNAELEQDNRALREG